MERIKKVIEVMKLNILKIDTVPESYSSEVCSIVLENGEKAILKIPYNRNKLLKEYKMLQLLKGKLPIAEVLDFWDGDDEIPGALLLSYIEGKPISGKVSEDLAFQMGELLAKLHTIKIKRKDLGDMDKLIYTEKDKWWETIKSWFDGCAEDCKDEMDGELLDKCIRLFNHYYENLPEPDYTCVVHMDYRPGNIMAKDSRITGLIDFETARIGSADIDFAKMKLFVWDVYPNTKEAFLKGYEKIRPLPDLERTLPFYVLYNAFVGFGWCVNRGKVNDEFCKFNMDILRKNINKINY